MSGQNLASKDFRETGWKKSVVVENVSLITDLKSCFISMTQKRFQQNGEYTNKSSLQKIYICNLELVSAVFIKFSFFLPNDSPSKTMKNAFYFI